jgi:hypothetical protein
MKLFRCLIEGANFPFELEGEAGLFGFYTTRFVRADTPEQAELLALEILRADSKLDVPPAKRTKDTMVYFREIEEISAMPDGVPDSGTGYAFFPMGS